MLAGLLSRLGVFCWAVSVIVSFPLATNSWFVVCHPMSCPLVLICIRMGQTSLAQCTIDSQL